nr:immunoglobulin light chain junction region [Macaca mulatta]
YQQYNSLPYSF